MLHDLKEGGVDKHLIARMFFSAFMHFAFTVRHTQFCFCSTIISFVKQVCKQKVIGHSCSAVPLTHSLLHLAHLRFFNTVGQQIAHHSEHQDRSVHVLHPDVGDQSRSLARTALSTVIGESRKKMKDKIKCNTEGDNKQMNSTNKEQTWTEREEQHGWRVSCNTSVKGQSQAPGMQCVPVKKEASSIICKNLADRKQRRDILKIHNLRVGSTVQSRCRRESGTFARSVETRKQEHFERQM